MSSRKYIVRRGTQVITAQTGFESRAPGATADRCFFLMVFKGESHPERDGYLVNNLNEDPCYFTLKEVAERLLQHLKVVPEGLLEALQADQRAGSTECFPDVHLQLPAKPEPIPLDGNETPSEEFIRFMAAFKALTQMSYQQITDFLASKGLSYNKKSFSNYASGRRAIGRDMCRTILKTLRMHPLYQKHQDVIEQAKAVAASAPLTIQSSKPIEPYEIADFKNLHGLGYKEISAHLLTHGLVFSPEDIQGFARGRITVPTRDTPMFRLALENYREMNPPAAPPSLNEVLGKEPPAPDLQVDASELPNLKRLTAAPESFSNPAKEDPPCVPDLPEAQPKPAEPPLPPTAEEVAELRALVIRRGLIAVATDLGEKIQFVD